MVSLNVIYKGIHWKDRKTYKDNWRQAFRDWEEHVYFENPVHISYVFLMKYPMDSSNLAFMVKLIEDALTFDKDEPYLRYCIKDDSPKYVLSTTMIPVKSKENSVIVHITDEERPSYAELLELAGVG